MSSHIPDRRSFIKAPLSVAPMSLQRIAEASREPNRHWIGPDEALTLSADVRALHDIGKNIMIRLAIEAPLLHASGHPGGPLSAFTICYEVMRRADPLVDEPLRMSPGHLSLLAYALQWMFGRDGGDKRLSSPEAILTSFRTASGLPGHIEAGIGDIPFGTGPLGKAVSNALGVAFARKYRSREGRVDVLLADGDSQEGQVMEAFRLASALSLDQLIVHGDWNDVQLSDLPSKTVAADVAAIAAAAGWSVIEVQNGNDQSHVAAALALADQLRGNGRPIFICYYTTMGSGVALMEEGSNTGKKNYHGSPLSKEEAAKALSALQLPTLSALAASFEPARSASKKAFEAASKRRASSVLPFALPKGYTRSLSVEPGAARKDFGAKHLLALMAGDPRIVVLHADLADSGGFGAVQKKFPHRVINVGVAEANMVMMAAGMRQAGLLPVTYTFAAFGTNEARANVRLIDINSGHVPLGVLYDCTHAGLSVGEDGETHQERNYLTLPFDSTQVWVAGDSNQAAAMAEAGLSIIARGTESVFVFSGRSNHPQLLTSSGAPLYDASYVFDGRATTVLGTDDLSDEASILSYGSALHEAVKAVEILRKQHRSIRLLNVACIRPLDASAILKAALETRHLIVVEDHNTEGGLATNVADLIADLSVPCTLHRLGVRHYHPSAPADELMLLAGIDAESIVAAVEDAFAYRFVRNEETLLAFLTALPHRLPSTRFSVRAAPYLATLSTNQQYLSALRSHWKEAATSPKKLPTLSALMEALAAHPVDGFNPLTGMPHASQHDIGFIDQSAS